MDIVAARFPGVERCDMERIARWARRAPRSALGAWPDAQMRQVELQSGDAVELDKRPLCESAADTEAVYLTLLDHHVLEVVRSATPESFTDRVIRCHLRGDRNREPPEPDPETQWCLQSGSTDAGHWEAVWKQYRKANGTKKTGESMKLAMKLRHRALATERSASNESPTVDGPGPAQTPRSARPARTKYGGCVDAEFCRLGASDLMKRVALDLRMMALSFDMDAVIHGRNNHAKHLLIVHRVLAAYEAEAQTELQTALAGAVYHPPIASNLSWDVHRVSTQPSSASITPSARLEKAAMQDASTALSPGHEPSSAESAHLLHQNDDRTPRAPCREDKSPPVSPPPDANGAALDSEPDTVTTAVPSKESTAEKAKPDERKAEGGAEQTRSSAAVTATTMREGHTTGRAADVAGCRSDVSLPVRSAQLQAAAAAGIVRVRPSPADAVAAVVRARANTPLYSVSATNLKPAWEGSLAPRPATSNLPADVVDEGQRPSVNRHRDHRWGVRRKERQEKQAWLEKLAAAKRAQQQSGVLTSAATRVSQVSQRKNKLGGQIPSFHQDRSRWGTLRTQSKLARHQDFVAGNKRMIERSLSASSVM